MDDDDFDWNEFSKTENLSEDIQKLKNKLRWIHVCKFSKLTKAGRDD